MKSSNNLKKLDENISLNWGSSFYFKNNLNFSASSMTMKVSLLQSTSVYDEKLNIQAKKVFVDKIIKLIKEGDFEFGYENKIDEFVDTHIKKNGSLTKEWLNDIYLKNYSNKTILLGILRIFSRMDLKYANPQGPTMALGVLSNSDSEIVEMGIRAFENWSSYGHIKVLKQLQLPEGWLNEYLISVVKNLEFEYDVPSPKI